MNQILFIFLGGGLGSLTRFYLGKFIQSSFSGTFPVGTLAVNIMASLILGLFLGTEIRGLSASYRALIAVGFCGGFSTFSTFSNDTLQLIQANRWFEAFINIVLNVVVCIAATFVGIFLAKP